MELSCPFAASMVKPHGHVFEFWQTRFQGLCWKTSVTPVRAYWLLDNPVTALGTDDGKLPRAVADNAIA